MYAIIQNTFREALAKKIFIGYYIFYVIVIIITYFAVNLDAIEGIISLTDVKQTVMSVESGFIGLAFPMILFFCIISASSFIPSMVEKGNIDVLISKPISRFNILLSKYIGSILFIFASMVFLLGSMWLIISLKTGYWNATFLYSAFSFTLTFAIMYSISVLIGLTIQSSIISILVNFFLIFVLCPLLSVRETLIFTFVKNDAVQFVFNFIYYIIPKPGEIKDITMYIITEQAIPFWKGSVNAEIGMVSPSWMSLISSVLFGIVVMSYSFYYFSKKDY